MIPIRDEIRSRKIAWVRNLLIISNILAFLYMFSLGSGVEFFVKSYAFFPKDFLTDPFKNFTGAFTYQFLHGGLLHLIGNLWYLWIFGDNVEGRMGSLQFLIFYLLAGFASCLTQTLVFPSNNIPLVGASGSIAGVLGAYTLLFPTARVVTWVPIFGLIGATVRVPALVFLLFWFIYQFLLGSSTSAQAANMGGVAWWAHVGGYVFGLLYILNFR